MNEDVREEVDRLVPQRFDRGRSRRQRRRVTERATGTHKEGLAIADRGRATMITYLPPNNGGFKSLNAIKILAES